MPLPSLSDVGSAAAVAAAVVGTAFGLWKRQSATGLDVATNNSKKGWISELQQRAETAEQRERETYEKYQESQRAVSARDLTIAMMKERQDRMDTKLQAVIDILIENVPNHPLSVLLRRDRDDKNSDFGALLEPLGLKPKGKPP